jgi:predicted phosphodiesterase
MKIRVLSDLHLEFSSFKPGLVVSDVVVLAGDIGVGVEGLIWAKQEFPGAKVIYVPGNHELYGSERSETMDLLCQFAKACDIHLLNDQQVVLRSTNGQAVRFLGCTLWTDFLCFGESYQEQCITAGQLGLNDFRKIKEGGSVFSAKRSLELHQQSLAWLTSRLEAPFSGKTVVVTHHLPSMASVSSRFKTSLLTACFASELSHLFGKMELWIHGHTHNSCDYLINGTRVVCNPRGYVTRNHIENTQFDSDLVIEI